MGTMVPFHFSYFMQSKAKILVRLKKIPQSKSKFNDMANPKQKYWYVSKKFLQVNLNSMTWRSKISNLLSLSDLANLHDVFGYSISIYGASSSMNLRLERC